MDATLQQYYARAAEIKQNIADENYTLITATDNYVAELTTMQQYLEDTLATIKTTKAEVIKQQQQNKNIINHIHKPIYTQNCNLNLELFGMKSMKIVKVNSVADVQETPLYWIAPLKQYAINIGGMLLRGNVGKIYNSVAVAKNPTLPNLIYCRHRNSCDVLLAGKVCKYYHDPQELYYLKLAGLIDSKLLDAQLHPRNFINTSWIYTDYPEKPSNSNMRHFGSADTLFQYIQLAKLEDNVKTNQKFINYADQCMHDILVMFAIYSNDLFRQK